MENIKLAIFDMDGTVLDTLEDLTDASNYVLKKHGYPERSIDEIRCFVGNGLLKLSERMVPAGTDAATVSDVCAELTAYYKAHSAVKTKPYPGICTMLENLRRAGIKTACVSNKVDAAVSELRDMYFKGLFDYSVGAREGKALKPAPDSVYAVLDYFGARKCDAVYIGDSETDMKTAENAGLKMIAVLWGFRDEATLKKAHAKRLCTDAAGLETEIMNVLFRKKEFELVFLGTGTAHMDKRALPGGDCENHFDKSVRRCSSALLNGNCLIDCGPFTVSSLKIIGKPLSEITDIFFTHLHGDHYRAEAVAAVAAAGKEPLRVWLREDAVFPEIPNVELHRLADRVTVNTPCGFKVTGLRSNHDQKFFPEYLYFESGEKHLLYATDGAWMLFETYYFLRNSLLDLLVWDSTVGDDPTNFRMAEHNSLPMQRLMRGSLESLNVLGKDSVICMTHIGGPGSCGHLPTQEEIEKQVEPDGFVVAYDGFRIEC